MQKNLPPSKEKLKKLRRKGQYGRVDVAQRFLAHTGFWLVLWGLLRYHRKAVALLVEQGLAGRMEVKLYPFISIALFPLCVAVVVSCLFQRVYVGGPLCKERKSIVSFESFKLVSMAKRVRQQLVKLSIIFLPFVLLLFGSALVAVVLCFRVAITGTHTILGLSRLGEQCGMYCWLVAVLALAIYAVVDFALEKVFFMRQHRMSLKELKDELKEQEGDPLMKGRQRRFFLSY